MNSFFLITAIKDQTVLFVINKLLKQKGKGCLGEVLTILQEHVLVVCPYVNNNIPRANTCMRVTDMPVYFFRKIPHDFKDITSEPLAALV